MSGARTDRCTSRPSRRSSISIPSSSRTLRVGTRASALALRQTDIAIEAMLAVQPGVRFEVVEISTKGDRDKTTPFEQLGTKAIFAQELQAALLDDRIDIAVHSLKDLTTAEPDGLVLAAFLEREDPRDVLVSRTGQTLAELDPGATVGTSSVRREALIRIARPDLETTPLRGNVDTRLNKVADGVVDAAVLAAAGIVRLRREDEITQRLDPIEFIPPPGQGAIALEARADELEEHLDWLGDVDHRSTRVCVEAERAFMRVVEGSCEVPLGAWARLEDDSIVIDAFLASTGGELYVRDSARGTDPSEMGAELGRTVLAKAEAHG